MLDLEMPTQNTILLSHALKDLREKSGLSQNKLAKLAGFSPTYPHLIERGEREPSLTILHAWAEACDARLEISLVPRSQSSIMISVPQNLAAIIAVLKNLSEDHLRVIFQISNALPLMHDNVVKVIESAAELASPVNSQRHNKLA